MNDSNRLHYKNELAGGTTAAYNQNVRLNITMYGTAVYELRTEIPFVPKWIEVNYANTFQIRSCYR